jgi:hypothetical protein
MSADNRYTVAVLASTDGQNEVAGTPENVFVHDTCEGATSGCAPSVTLVSAGVSNKPANAASVSPSISADGRFVTFISSATNLVAGDTNDVADIFVRDTCAGASGGCTPSTQLVSVSTSGTPANGASTAAAISATGRYITFTSTATSLDAAASATSGLFLRDTCAGADVPCTPSTRALQ